MAAANEQELVWSLNLINIRNGNYPLSFVASESCKIQGYVTLTPW